MYYGHVSSTSNREDWQEACVLTDMDTGELIDISLCRVTMTVMKSARNPNSYAADGYYGRVNPGAIVLQGSTDSGEITLVDVGTFQWTFTKDQMAGLPQGEYKMGVRISQDDRTVQLIIGTVNVDEGIDWQ
jgi:hypothetical protein